MDGNITTLLGCVVMYFLGTSAIKSFALTLAIGILISIFTALVVTRLLVSSFLAFNRENPKLYNLYNKNKEESGDVMPANSDTESDKEVTDNE